MLKKLLKQKSTMKFMAWLLVGIMTLSIGGVMPVSATEAQTSWSFAGNFETIQGTVGDYQGIIVDATNGKLRANGTSAQMNQGTILRVPVTGPCSVTVTPHNGEAQYALYTINNVQASTTESSTTVEYTGGAGYVEIVSTNNNAYISAIELAYHASSSGDVSGGDVSGGNGNGSTGGNEGDATGNELATMTVDTAAESCDFKGTGQIFGQDSITADVAYSVNKYIMVEKGSNASLDIGGNTHGLCFSSDVKFSAIVPANTKGVFTVTQCQWASSNGYLMAGDKTVVASTSLSGTTDGVSTLDFAYENTTSEAVTITLVAVPSGAGYIHGISYDVETILNEEPTIATKEYVLNVSDLTAGTTAGEKAGTDNYFTLTEGMTIESNSKSFTVGSETISATQRMKAGGDGTSAKKSILFTVDAGATATIYVCTASSSGSADAQVVLCDMDGKIVDWKFIERGVSTTAVFEDVAAGSYYITSMKSIDATNTVTGNVNFYYVKVAEEKAPAEIVEKTFNLNVSDLTAGTTAGEKAGTDNYFTLTEGMTIESNSKSFTVGSETISATQRMKAGGDGTSAKKSILFTVDAGATATIYVCTASSSGSADAQVVLCDMDGKIVDWKFIERGVSTTAVFEDVAAGSYYITSMKSIDATNTVTGNVNFYYVRVTETVSSGGEEEEEGPKYLELDGEEKIYDLRVSTFGAYAAEVTGEWTHEDGILSIDRKISLNGSQHGAAVSTGTTFTVNAPAGRTIITLGACKFGSGKAVLYVNGEAVSEEVAIGALSNDTTEAVLEYTSEEDVVISIVISGNGYLHFIKAKSETPPNSYILSGSLTGLTTDELASLTELKFTATVDSQYKVPAATIDKTAGTYSIELEMGTPYKVVAIGTGNKVIKTTVPAYEVDTTLDLVFEAVPTYKVTISKTSTPDLSQLDVEYVFTHEDGNEYSFADVSAIVLRDGVYELSFAGDFEKVAYKITSGDSLTVDGKAVNHLVKFAEVTSWAFTGGAFSQTIEGGTGYYQGLYIDATNGKIAPNGNDSTALNAGTIIRIPVSGTGKVVVTPHKGEAKYALYQIGDVKASTTESSTEWTFDDTVEYLDLVAYDKAYISSIAVSYEKEATEVEYVEQSVMPFVPESDTDAATDYDDDGIPRGNTKENMVVQPVGQKLTFAQEGGAVKEKFEETSGLTYYVFPKTDKAHTLEFDLVVASALKSDNSAGFFGGVFTDNYLYTIGLRKGTTIRGIYSKSAGAFAGAGSPTEENLGFDRTIHYSITVNEGRPEVVITFYDDDGVLQTREWSQSAIAEPDGSAPEGFYYGFIVANISATVTNMVYKDANGKVLYDQNACYYPMGEKPVASDVTAVASEDRTYIDVSWAGTVPENDGTYVVEMKKDNGAWTELTDDVVGFSYRYEIPAGEGGNYLFRVAGQLGKKSLGGEKSAYATMTESVYVLGALEKPEVVFTAPQVGGDVTTGTIALDWQDIKDADYYEVYRYSSDQGASGAEKVATVTASEYVDNAAAVDMPYYYYVKAIDESANNESPYSDIVWTVVTTTRDNSVIIRGIEAESKIFVTKKSYDTVFTNSAVLEGIVYEEGTFKVTLNGTVVKEESVEMGDEFALDFTLQQGRNEVVVELWAGNKVYTLTHNFVYLTNYDIVVDAAYTGTDGATDTYGKPAYKTVQAAVNSVATNNSDRVTILVLAGSYEERLVVNTPNITLIGEDRNNTLIHFYPGVLGDKYAAGEDMDKRCATYIQSGATGFTAENISFANDYVYGSLDKSNESADAIRVEANNSTFVNVKFVGVQDTLYMHSGYQYYYNCLIEGLVDYIYSGEEAKSVFEKCELRFVYESSKTSGYVSAPKTKATGDYGLTFIDCAITAEEGCAGTGYLLARPWGADAYITWINCYMGKTVNALAPYSDMSGNMHENARFFEYGTYGPGFAINADRRQISVNQANSLVSGAAKGDTNMTTVATDYVGSIVTDREAQFEEKEPNNDIYLWNEGDDTGLGIFKQEGYASYYEVTGGGLLKESNDNYYAVNTAEEFLDALLAIKASGKNSVIELKADINLGCNEVDNFSTYSSRKLLTEYSAQALTHPTLIESGVSKLQLEGYHNLTIFSQEGYSIKHANITFKKSTNIIIRNIKFDELWEWDEATNGDYDRNDWDYMTIDDSANGIWIDHCTFYKAYDGIVDIKNPNPTNYVTISWCEFLPGSENNVFFDVMMDEVTSNPDKYPTTYQAMKAAGMTEYQIYMYAYGQKKTHLLGQDDSATNAAGIRLTMANNYYYDSMDRMPRLRYGDAHVYNCIMDSQELLDIRNAISNEKYASKIVSNGAASTCGAQVLLENCYISGINNALNSGNGDSPSGYINDKNCLYYMNGELTELAPKVNTSLEDEPLLVLDADAFIASLPYSDYNLYDAADLYSVVVPRSGAGKVDMTVLQWLKTSYNVTVEEEENPEESIEIIETKSEVAEGIPAEKAEEVLNAVGDALGVETVEELETLLTTEITEADGATAILPGLSENNTSVVEVTVKISKDGGNTWTEITSTNANEFPTEGVEVVIPYPEGTNAAGYQFVIGHLIVLGCNGKTPGSMEYYNPTETTNGLKIRIYSASPFVIGYKENPKPAASAPVVIPSTIDWEKVNAEVIAQAAATSANVALGNVNVEATSSGEIVVPAFVMESLKGENVTLMLHNGRGVAMSITGSFVTGAAVAVNVTVNSNVNTIPANVVASKTTNAMMTKQISVKNSGYMPVMTNMHVSIGAEFAGEYANLYRYDVATSKLELVGCFLVSKDGQAMFAIGQGGEYLLTVTDDMPTGTIVNTASRYVVKRGDSMYAIARMYKMKLSDLHMKNPQVKDINLIYVGDTINIK